MDYLQQLEWRNHLFQIKVRVLNELKNYLESADASELSQFSKDLNAILTAKGVSLKNILFHLLSTGNAPSGWSPSRYPFLFEPPPSIPAGSFPAVPQSVETSPSGGISQTDPTAPAPDLSTEDDPTVRAKEPLLESIKLNMKVIPQGIFQMGSKEGREEEQPAHRVKLSSFKLCSKPVTCKEYQAFVLANPEWQKDRIDPGLHEGKYLNDWEENEIPEEKENHPVCYVSFHAAQAFAAWVDMRLPTEAEWEYAARGGLTGKNYPNGDSIDDKNANFAKRYRGTTPVGNFKENGYGLFDMVGNIFEWTADWYGAYTGGEQNDPKGPSSGEYRVIKGGSWASGANTVRVSFRIDEEPERCGFIGFRVAE